MNKKGIFNGLYIIIFLVLIAPLTTTNINTNTLSEAFSQINHHFLELDGIIVSRLGHLTQTGESDNCKIRNSHAYNAFISAKINDYLSNTNCSVSKLSPTMDGTTYYGEITLTCTFTGNLPFTITKEYSYSKEIILDVGAVDCNVTIEDNYNNNDIQLKLT